MWTERRLRNELLVNITITCALAVLCINGNDNWTETSNIGTGKLRKQLETIYLLMLLKQIISSSIQNMRAHFKICMYGILYLWETR